VDVQTGIGLFGDVSSRDRTSHIRSKEAEPFDRSSLPQRFDEFEDRLIGGQPDRGEMFSLAKIVEVETRLRDEQRAGLGRRRRGRGGFGDLCDQKNDNGNAERTTTATRNAREGNRVLLTGRASADLDG